MKVGRGARRGESRGVCDWEGPGKHKLIRLTSLPLSRSPPGQPRCVRRLWRPHQACTPALGATATPRMGHLFLIGRPRGGTICNLSVWSGLCFVPKDLACDRGIEGLTVTNDSPLVSSISNFPFWFCINYFTSWNTILPFGQESIVASIALLWDPEMHRVITSSNLPPFISTQNSESLSQPSHWIVVTHTQLPHPSTPLHVPILCYLSDTFSSTLITTQNLVVQLSGLIGGRRPDKDMSNDSARQWGTEVCSQLVSSRNWESGFHFFL